ncbi:MAG: hypothetical protein HZB19_10385 [Chloroflexi bacterium]|nr:hypothetical protein [Chloroflexota bacterium]
MSTHQNSLPPFWPSRRLWLKFFIGLIYVPLLFSLLIWVFITFSFSPMDMQGRYLTLFFLLLIGGPVSVGLLLAPSWHGAGAGFLALISMLLAWNLAGHLGLRNLPQNVGEAIAYAVLSASGVSVLELIVRDITKRSELLGLGIGVVAGFLVSLLFVSIFSPYHPMIAIPSAYSSMFGIVGWSIQVAINWISVFFFVDLSGRRVGWGGGIVWAALVGIIFAISFALMK